MEGGQTELFAWIYLLTGEIQYSQNEQISSVFCPRYQISQIAIKKCAREIINCEPEVNCFVGIGGARVFLAKEGLERCGWVQ